MVKFRRDRAAIMIVGLWLCTLTAALGAGANDAGQLARAFEAAIKAKNWPRAIAAGEKLAEIRPAGGTSAYNLACAYARSGDAASAADWLVKAGEAGFQGASLIRTDPDLQGVRELPRYAQAVALVDQNRERNFAAFKQAHEDTRAEVILPPGHDPKRPAPLIIALHSYGGSPQEQIGAWRQVAAGAGAVLVVPCAQRKLGNGGYQWLFMDESEWLALKALEDARRQCAIDPSRVIITGFSQGGNLAFYVASRHPELFAGVIPMGFHFEPDVAPLPDPPPDRMPAYVFLIGAHDEAAATNATAAKVVQAAGARAKLRSYRGVGHEMPPNRHHELGEALKFVLAEPAPAHSPARPR